MMMMMIQTCQLSRFCVFFPPSSLELVRIDSQRNHTFELMICLVVTQRIIQRWQPIFVQTEVQKAWLKALSPSL